MKEFSESKIHTYSKTKEERILEYNQKSKILKS